jgi:hypothetical protein
VKPRYLLSLFVFDGGTTVKSQSLPVSDDTTSEGINNCSDKTRSFYRREAKNQSTFRNSTLILLWQCWNAAYIVKYFFGDLFACYLYRFGAENRYKRP